MSDSDRGGRILDITRPLGPDTRPWPGDEPFRISSTLRIREGASVNLGSISTSLHNATHADAPYHVADGGETAERLDPGRYLGPARVVEAEGVERIDVALVEDLLRPKPPERLLVRTGCWERAGGRFPERFPPLDPAAGRKLVDAGVVLVGTDAPSVDPLESKTLEAHHALIGGGVAILENLDLSAVPPGEYELIALPLRIVGGDASPVRAVLREITGTRS